LEAVLGVVRQTLQLALELLVAELQLLDDAGELPDWVSRRRDARSVTQPGHAACWRAAPGGRAALAAADRSLRQRL
jgi:hypothetical protein